jgi:predicted ATP-grasp superfamily ATP-dependent carboligase
VPRGTLLLGCSDHALRFLAGHRDDLVPRYLVDLSLPEQHGDLLDKLRTLEMGREVGVPVPAFWTVEEPRDLEDAGASCRYPVLLKPRDTHGFFRRFGRKLETAGSPDELVKAGRWMLSEGIAFTVVEFIPGSDDRLCSYYTYHDGGGNPLFHFTKRVLRRSPVHFGGASLHVTEWMEDVAEMGRRFFHGVGLRGFGNIEFKRDPRDGTLRLMEVNPRFTAAQELITRAGLDMPWIVYRHLTGEPVPATNGYREGLHLWYPGRDVDAFRDLRARDDLGFGEWVGSLLGRRKLLPYLRLTDPLPAVRHAVRSVRARVLARVGL